MPEKAVTFTEMLQTLIGPFDTFQDKDELTYAPKGWYHDNHVYLREGNASFACFIPSAAYETIPNKRKG